MKDDQLRNVERDAERIASGYGRQPSEMSTEVAQALRQQVAQGGYGSERVAEALEQAHDRNDQAELREAAHDRVIADSNDPANYPEMTLDAASGDDRDVDALLDKLVEDRIDKHSGVLGKLSGTQREHEPEAFSKPLIPAVIEAIKELPGTVREKMNPFQALAKPKYVHEEDLENDHSRERW